jgi:hypothetical protein
MKKILFLSLAVLFSYTSFAQKKGEMPKVQIPKFKYNEQNEVVYTEVVATAGSATDLYLRLQKWFNAYYKNPNEVIKEKKENESIVGKGKYRLFDVNAENGSKTPGGILNYTITVSVKEGKYRYEITKVSNQQTSYYGIENWIKENTDGYRFQTANYLVQADEELNKLIKDLKKVMSTPIENKKEDW